MDKKCKLVNGVTVEWSAEDYVQLELDLAAEAERVAAAELVRYKELRAAEYPSLTDQLDTIYHKGIDAWKAEIATIKAKYPKP